MWLACETECNNHKGEMRYEDLCNNEKVSGGNDGNTAVAGVCDQHVYTAGVGNRVIYNRAFQKRNIGTGRTVYPVQRCNHQF